MRSTLVVSTDGKPMALIPVAPRVRIKRVVLDNFKNIQHGEIVFFGKKAEPGSVLSGLYGPNATGKTSVIDAISLLQLLTRRKEFKEEEMRHFGEWIRDGAEEARLQFELEVLYPASESKHTEFQLQSVIYSFSILPGNNGKPPKFGREVIQMGGDFDGKKIRLQPVFDTNYQGAYGFGPASKVPFFVREDDQKLAAKIMHIKEKGNCSVPFSMAQNFAENSRVISKRGFFEIESGFLRTMICIGRFISVVRSSSRDMIVTDEIGYRLNIHLSSYDNSVMTVPLDNDIIIDPKNMKHFVRWFKKAKKFLHVLLPNIDIGYRVFDQAEQGICLPEGFRAIRMYTIREGKEKSLRDESEGVVKLISMGVLLFDALNDDSTCLVIDEIENGIFEYLLIQLIILFKEYGHGQLIFTSHNFRILEVLPKECIWFTTADPGNRFVRMRYVATENNLRKLYYRKIALGDPKIEYYNGSGIMDIRNVILSDDGDDNNG